MNMLNMFVSALAFNVVWTAGEKLTAAGFKAAEAFKGSRAARRAPTAVECLNGDPGPIQADLIAFRVTVADRDTSGAVGWAVHDLYAESATDAANWAFNYYENKGEENLRVMVEAVQ